VSDTTLGNYRFETSFKNSKPDDLADGQEIAEVIGLQLRSAFFREDLAKISGRLAGRRLVVKLELFVREEGK
jgi:hypothetical protein